MTGKQFKEDVTQHHLKFDDKGTLNICGYNSDGKRVDLLAIKNGHSLPNVENPKTLLDEAKNKTEKSRIAANIANTVIATILFVLVACVINLALK